MMTKTTLIAILRTVIQKGEVPPEPPRRCARRCCRSGGTSPSPHRGSGAASPSQKTCRSGLTLLEIVLSLAIFLGALAALSQLAWNGTRATVQARLKTQATIRCETKLNEVVAGIEPMQARQNVAFPDDSQWTWSQVVTPSSHPELVQLDVTVSHRGTSRLARIDVTLRRWAREQSLFVSAVKQEKVEEEEKAKPK